MPAPVATLSCADIMTEWLQEADDGNYEEEEVYEDDYDHLGMEATMHTLMRQVTK